MNYQSHLNVAALVMLSSYGACASAEGTKPHDMSTAQHEATAAREETDSKQHGSQYAPGASVESERCSDDGACWTDKSNPTEQHQSDMLKHKQLAEQHRAAAQALRDAENRTCVGLSEEERVTSPFYHRQDIASVSKAEASVSDGLGTHPAFVGGRVVFRALPGMTAEWLQRLVDCHLARTAAVGFSMPEMSYCPLMLKGVNATVSSVGNGFAVNVTSKDPETATEIWRRIQALK